MANPWSQYQKIVIETYDGAARGHHGKVRARPVKGEIYPTSMVVECSKEMRMRHPIGTKFRIYAKETNREGGATFLYTHFSWPYEIVD